ncbi:MAG TPA: class I SAM-dependent methyltransferase [Bryobacteraceae bacterium]|nr:class I SAM-dependent methyltransferase [Bryobacteraceae bacterium]
MPDAIFDPAQHAKPEDFLRTNDLMALLPPGHSTVLEIGARHGFITRYLAERFQTVTALDLEKPSIPLDRVIPVQGDVRHLDFPDNSFDCVLCTEVLEHIADLAAAAGEISRVARHDVLIGVPYRQDIRVGRVTCNHCGKFGPAYGHINKFDEAGLRKLFSPLSVSAIHYVSKNTERTNALAVWLQDLGGNRYGTYEQEEPCIHCGREMVPRDKYSLLENICTAAGLRLYAAQALFNKPRPTWIHILFHKS